MKSKLRHIFVILLCSLTHLFAQATPDGHGIRFRTLGWALSADDLYYDVHGHDTKILITNSARSVFFDAPTVKQMVFYRLVPDPTTNKPMREIAGTVDISAAGPWPLLIFTTDPDSPKRYRVAAIADDLKVFPFPSCRFVNLSMVDLYAKYGDQQIKLPAKGIELLDPHLKSTSLKSTDEPEARYFTVSMNTPEGPRLLYSNNWAARPTQRTLVFISPQEGGIQIIRVSDHIALYTTPGQ